MFQWFWLLAICSLSLVSQTGHAPPVKTFFIAISIFVIVKAQSLVSYRLSGNAVSWSDQSAWFLFWPGLNPKRFFEPHQSQTPSYVQWFHVVGKTIAGGLLLFFVAPQLVERRPFLAGWVAIVGILLLFHFGVCHLLALGWRVAGRDVRPIMEAPLLTGSLSEFWGRRWNVAFRDFAHTFVFRPCLRRWGAGAATWVGFVFSGFIHELAISVPAGGGFGLPTTYFLFQGVGVWLERKGAKAGLPIRGGVGGWLFAAVFLLPGALFLFHPTFVERVIVPLIPVP